VNPAHTVSIQKGPSLRILLNLMSAKTFWPTSRAGGPAQGPGRFFFSFSSRDFPIAIYSDHREVPLLTDPSRYALLTPESTTVGCRQGGIVFRPSGQNGQKSSGTLTRLTPSLLPAVNRFFSIEDC